MGARIKPENEWTDTRVALLRKHYDDKIQLGQIAALINQETGSSYTRNSICGMCYRLHLPPRRRTIKERPKGPSDPVLRERKRQATRLNIRRKDNSEAIGRRKVIADFDQFAGPAHLRIAFFDLERHHCRFPKGEGIDATYCGQGVKGDSHWCPFHFDMVYRPAEARTQRAA